MTDKLINISIEFTNTYKRYIDAPVQIREVMCLKSLYPVGLKSLKSDDIFAGNANIDGTSGFNKLPIVFNPKKESQIGYFMSIPTLKYYETQFPEKAEKIEEMIEFWKKESTFVKILNSGDEEIHNFFFPYRMGYDEYGYMRKSQGKKRGSGFISGSFDTRVAGIMPDFSDILTLGIKGLDEKISEYEKINGSNDFYTACHLAIGLISDTLDYYKNQAEELIKTCDDSDKSELSNIIRILKKLKTKAPDTLREAIQLVIIFTVLTGIDNFGRMDVYLGDFLCSDLEKGIADEEEELKYIMAFWDFIFNNCGAYDSRVIIGGKGRKNEKNADKFAMLAMEAVRRKHKIKPVLTLRIYKGQNTDLYEKALDCISEGCIYPTLYNDDACIKGFMKSMNMPYEDAVDYTPLGCGEMVVAGKSISSPNSTFRMLKALEAVLHNGCDGSTGNLVGVKTGELNTFDTFDKIFDAFLKQLDARLAIDCKVHAHNKQITAQEAGFVIASMFMNGCIEKGKDIFHGGVKYFGANIEGFGLTNTINSLAVIKKLVFEDKTYTLEKIVKILDADFEGYEEDRKVFLKVDKFGNNKSWVDDMKLKIEAFINERANKYAKEYGLDYCTVASVNPGGITIGPTTAASADGRKCGEPFALANSPMPGTDISGLTAMLLSCAKADPANGGYVTNMNISRETMVHQREKVSKVFLKYFEIGGLQLNINCFSRGELEKALIEPKKYSHIIVRVSGYSARFIDLDKTTQKHIMERTLY